MNIYIAIHNYSPDKKDVYRYSDEAYFFESEDTLPELIKKELDIVPALKDNEIVFFVIENTQWNSDLMAELWEGRIIKEWYEFPAKTSWKGKIRLWKWEEFGLYNPLTGLKWILEHAKQISPEEAV